MKNSKLIAAIACLTVSLHVCAHKFSTAYMDVKVVNSQPVLLWKVALHDLAQARLITADNSHQVSWQQVIDSAPALNTYLNEHLAFSSAGSPCLLEPAPAGNWQLQQLQRDHYLVLAVTVNCDSATDWQVSYRALFASEPSHKLLLSWQVPGEAANGVLSADSDTFPLN
ncbi:hypothetical protein [Arsukibacterium indicum]|uniref:Uncharacterized protein n=1 Tax=Arsukibacterium indicum TaxID=2848612 RepID=A0ABS6MGT4_9GAMM|nr:hypothetical protein [Arsukibacterium indicum]MBV2128009.1 hypothetical protein [Arsukibacterium indicum]